MKHVIGRPINISIAGFGNVGSTVAEVLLHDRFSQHYHYNINIMEPGYETTQHGKVLDFLQASVIHHRHHTISLNDEEIYLDSDYIVHCAGVTGSSIKSDRMELLDSSKVTTEMLFKNKKFSKRNLRIIALSNPLDIIAYYTREYSNLTPQNVVATGTYLDAMRLQYYITKELNIPEKYNVSCMVLGEHGTDMVPLFSNVYIKDNETDSIVEKLEFTQEQKDKLNYQTVNAASRCLHILNDLENHR